MAKTIPSSLATKRPGAINRAVTKAELRREMRVHLAALAPTRASKSAALVAALAGHPAMGRDRRVALFSPLPTEPDVEWLWQSSPARFCYPRMVRGELEFVEVEKLEELTVSSWHPKIREHTHAEARLVAPAEIDVILVPGLAFTRRGQRLGRGGGNYDRFLTRLPASAVKIGICFAVQVVETLPTEPHDQRVDAVVTEEGVLSATEPKR